MDIYQPPQADLIDSSNRAAPHYVVAIRKLLILFFSTLGIYLIYWFYRHWKAYNIHKSANTMPVLRAIFSVFFTHSLFRYFDENAGEHAGRWRGQWMATLFVAVTVLSWFLDQMVQGSLSVDEYFLLLAIFYVLQVIPICRGQNVANAKSNDPHGSGNSQLTAANWAWVFAGLALWALVIYGTAAELV